MWVELASTVRPCLYVGIPTSHWRNWGSDLVTFACIVKFIRRYKSSLGHERSLSHIMKTLVQDSTIYFFIMMTFNIAMLTYAVMARASMKNFPLV